MREMFFPSWGALSGVEKSLFLPLEAQQSCGQELPLGCTRAERPVGIAHSHGQHKPCPPLPSPPIHSARG